MLLGSDPHATDLWEIARKINHGLAIPLATHDSHTLHLISGVAGPEGEWNWRTHRRCRRCRAGRGAAHNYPGADAQPAQVRGAIHHASQGGLPAVDLTDAHYLLAGAQWRHANRDRSRRGADAATTTLDEVRDKINAAAGAPRGLRWPRTMDIS